MITYDIIYSVLTVLKPLLGASHILKSAQQFFHSILQIRKLRLPQLNLYKFSGALDPDVSEMRPEELLRSLSSVVLLLCV